MKIKNLLIKFITIFSVIVFTVTLTACSLTSKAKPAKEVMQKFQEASKNINTSDALLAIKLKGKSTIEEMDFNFNLGWKTDLKDIKNIKANVDLDGKGSYTTSGTAATKGEMGLKLTVIKDDIYFNLTKIDLDDPQFQAYKALLIAPYINKWEHIPKELLSEKYIPGITEIRKQNENALKKQKELYALLSQVKLFDVTKEYGIEKLQGKKVYHYGVKINKDGLKEYVQKAAKILETTVTDAEMADAMKAVDAMDTMDKKIELWIGYTDYFLYKGIFDISFKDTAKALTTDASITYTANSYNKALKITAPEKYEEFTVLSQLMGVMGTQAISTGDNSLTSDDSKDNIKDATTKTDITTDTKDSSTSDFFKNPQE